MSGKKILAIGMTLFAMFFGAGNLIFPPEVAYQAGEQYIPAMIGFLLAAIGLPFLTLVIGTTAEDGYTNLLRQVHPLFALLLLVGIFSLIGPLVGIPRTATTSFELAIVPFLPESNAGALLLFSLVFFALTLFLSLSPDQLVDTIGNILTPALLITIAVLIVSGIVHYSGNPSPVPDPEYQTHPLALGFTDGYTTLDALAAMLFSIVAYNTIQQSGVKEPKQILRWSVVSGSVAFVILGVVYFALGWLGNKSGVAVPADAENIGTSLLVGASYDNFGTFGTVILGVIVLLACLTTAVGLVAATASYFHTLVPRLNYRAWTILIIVVSFLLSNLGLDAILSYSQPILLFLYPIAMTAMFSLLVLYLFPGPKLALQSALVLVIIDSVLATAARGGISALAFMTRLPLFAAQLEWLLFMIVGFLFGYLFGDRKKQIHFY